VRIAIPDFDKVETGREALPPGTYTATVTGCQVGKSKVKQTPQVEWEFTVNGPTHVGRRVWDNTFLSEKALFTTKRLVVGVGAPFTPEGFNTEDCLGRRVTMVLGQEMMTDEAGNRKVSPNNTIDKITPLV